MKDEVLKKALESDQEIIPRYRVVNQDGSVALDGVEIQLVNEFDQVGTPYNKASVLPDPVAQIICPEKTDPTPADAFKNLGKKKQNKLAWVTDEDIDAMFDGTYEGVENEDPEGDGYLPGGGGHLLVTLTASSGVSEYTCSHTAKEIYDAVQNGKTVFLTAGMTQYSIMACHETVSIFGYYSIEDQELYTYSVHDDGTVYLDYLRLVAYQDNGTLYQDAEPQEDWEVANKAYVDGQVGDIETALDSIIAIQNELIGGDGA